MTISPILRDKAHGAQDSLNVLSAAARAYVAKKRLRKPLPHHKIELRSQRIERTMALRVWRRRQSGPQNRHVIWIKEKAGPRRD